MGGRRPRRLRRSLRVPQRRRGRGSSGVADRPRRNAPERRHRTRTAPTRAPSHHRAPPPRPDGHTPQRDGGTTTPHPGCHARAARRPSGRPVPQGRPERDPRATRWRAAAASSSGSTRAPAGRPTSGSPRERPARHRRAARTARAHGRGRNSLIPKKYVRTREWLDRRVAARTVRSPPLHHPPRCTRGRSSAPSAGVGARPSSEKAP